VVIEGSMREDGVFGADVLMTKCGSKYEAAERAGAGGQHP
jgi:cytochrome c-type biogenesis protein CcmE